MLQAGGVGGLKAGIATNLNSSVPPVFLAHAFDDGSENSLQLALALKRAEVPTEFHLFHEGVHGFGPRETGLPVGSWKQRFVAWLDALGQLDAPQVRSLSSETSGALRAGTRPLPFAGKWPKGTLADAYAVQRRVVRATRSDAAVAGYKRAGASAPKLDAPLTGVLFKSGRLEATPDLRIERAANEKIVIETKIGYVMGVDFSFDIPTDAHAHAHARDAGAAIVPVVELPHTYESSGGVTDPRDWVSANLGSARYIVGRRFSLGVAGPENWKSSLRCDGKLLNETTGQQAADNQGHVIREGDLIVCDGPGKSQSGQSGRYEARFGDLETITFEVR